MLLLANGGLSLELLGVSVEAHSPGIIANQGGHVSSKYGEATRRV
jgi:hypothetical protein